eukprot:COSAG02_NODE_5956_length_3913_cov_3.038794_2_plen_442_part_00
MTLELELPTLSMVCALEIDWLMIEEWALLLSPATRTVEVAESTDGQSFSQVLVVGRNDHPTSRAVRHFTCTAAKRARLELRTADTGQYGLMEVTIFGYNEAEDGVKRGQFEHGLCHCRNGGSCGRDAEGCRCPRHPSCPRFSRGCGWTGSHCEIDIDECAGADFGGCGAHSASAATPAGQLQGDPDRATCTNTPGSYSCDCRAPRWQGRATFSGGNVCVDANECRSRESNPCEGECHNTVGGFHCSCQNGFVLSSGYKCDPFLDDANEGDSSETLPWWTQHFGVDAYVFFTTISVLGSMCVLVTVAIAIAKQHAKENALAEQPQLSETALLLAEIPSGDPYFDEEEDLEDYFYGADRRGRRGRRATRKTVKVKMPVVLPVASPSSRSSGATTSARSDRTEAGWGLRDRQPSLPIERKGIPPPPPRTAEVEEYLRKDPRRRN